MGRYNPNSPYVMGMEFAPVVQKQVLVDTATELGYTFRADSQESAVYYARVLASAPPPGQPRRKCLAVNLYSSQYAPGTGPMRKIIIPLWIGGLGTGATLQGGAATVQAALKNPSDGGMVRLSGASAYCRMYFDVLVSRVSAALNSRRIADVSVLYAISGPFTSLPSAAVTLSLERVTPGTVWDMDDTITGPAQIYSNVVPRRSRLGDLNPFWSSVLEPTATAIRQPWKYAAGTDNHVGLTQMSGPGVGQVAARFTTSAAAAGMNFDVHYAALEVTYCQESRVGCGGLELSSGAVDFTGMYSYSVPISSPYSWGAGAAITEGYEYVATVGQGYSGVLSVSPVVPVPIDRVATAGAPFAAHRGVIIRKTLRAGEAHTAEETDAIPGIALYDSSSVQDATSVVHASQTYMSQVAVSAAGDFAGDLMARLTDDTAGTFPWLRFYARRSADTLGAILIRQTDSTGEVATGPQAGITVDEFDLLPEIANGWKQITLEWSTPVVTAGASAVLYFTIYADTDVAGPWQILGADANPNDTSAIHTALPSYGSTTVFATYHGDDDLSADLTFMLIQEMPQVTGLAVTPLVQALEVVDEACGLPVDAIPTGIRYHHLAWTTINTPVVAGWGFYEVQRRDSTMDADVWETIAEITHPAVVTMDDYEARAGVQSSYRVRMVHANGVAGDWSTTVNATITAPGVTGTGVDVGLLVLTSNHNPAGNLAYVHTYDSGQPVQEFAFPEGDDTVLQSMYGRDYRVAFRPLERAGTEFTRTLLVNAAGVPTGTMDKGFTGLRDLAWDTVPYVCVRDELANRWLTTVMVPSGAVRVVPGHGHIHLAAVRFAEVTDTPAPVDDVQDCEGFRLHGLNRYGIFDTPLPAVFNNDVEAADTFTRAVTDGWGTADTGGAYTLTGGATSDYDVTGAAATIVLTSANVARQGTLAGPWTNVAVRVRVGVSAVATVAPIRASVMMRYVDVSNHFRADVVFGLTGVLTLELRKRVAGVETLLDSATITGTYTGSTVVELETRVRGTYLDARAWRVGDAEAAFGTVFDTETVLAAGGPVGLRAIRDTGNTNANPLVTFDSLSVKRMPSTLDIRAQLRPYSDEWDISFNVYNPDGGFAGWELEIDQAFALMEVFNGGFFSESTSSEGLGLVKNRRAWVRALYTADDGTDTSKVQFYSGNDDGTVWTLVDTVTASPAEPIDPGALTNAVIETWLKIGGGVTVLSWQLLVDGVTILSPDFTAEDPGTTQFTDAQGNVWTSTEGALCES